MRIVPDSTVNLYSGVEVDNGEQLVFSSRANQSAYFASKLVLQQVNCQMIRKTGALRLEVAGSVVSTCNYLSFVNPSFDNRTVYARIIDYDYVNNECVEVAYAIDYWQTWMFDVTFQSSYIDREHLSQADYAKAETNPYDPTILEFRTSENLPISKDLEKLNYTIGTNADDGDGFRLSRGIAQVANVLAVCGVLIKLSEIDFADLDSQSSAPLPSQKFAQYLHDVIASGTGTASQIGFYILSKSMYTYLHNLYPSLVPSAKECGNDWVINGTTIKPFFNSKFTPPVTYIYDPIGADLSQNNGHMADLLELLTERSSTDSIIDMSVIPNNIMFTAGKISANDPTMHAGQKTAKTKISVTSKKLMRYPFSYMRIMAPNGDVKEIQYERFSNINSGTNDICEFAVTVDVSDKPTFIIAPLNYKENHLSGNNFEDPNILDSLLFSQFPTMPYTIDSFTAQVAAVANSTIANRTTDTSIEMGLNKELVSDVAQTERSLLTALGPVSGGVQGVTGIMEGGTGAISGGLTLAGSGIQGMGNYATEVQMQAERRIFEAQSQRWNNADLALAEADGSVIADQLKLSKPAYACDKYYPSNGCGSINFNYESFCDVILLRVSLSPEILSIYDTWFQHF